MTEGDGNKLFCICLTLWAPDENGGPDGDVRRVVLVLLSHWPFWSTMQQALLLLHMYASVDETKGLNSRYPSLGNNFIEAAVQFLVLKKFLFLKLDAPRHSLLSLGGEFYSSFGR